MNAEPEREFDAGVGEAGKLLAMSLLREHRYESVLKAQRAMVGLLLRQAEGSVDDLHRVLGEIANDGDPAYWLGAALHGLRLSGVIRKTGFVETCRKVAHRRPVSMWTLTSRPAALAWFDDHCERRGADRDGGDPMPRDGPGNDAGPAGAAAGPAGSEVRGQAKLDTGLLF